MKGSDILKLTKAGFTLEQIVQIDETLGLPGEDEPKPEPSDEQKPQAADEIAKATEQLTSVLDRILKANINGKEQPASETESTDDILANIIKGTPLPGKEG